MNGSSPIEIGFTDLHADGPLREDHQLLLGIDAHLRITVEGRVWFEEPLFPVVELAAVAAKWLRDGVDFLFETMEAEESPLMWVRQNTAGCTLGAAWQEYEEGRLSPCEQIRETFSHFIVRVETNVRKSLGVEVHHLLNGRSRDRLTGRSTGLFAAPVFGNLEGYLGQKAGELDCVCVNL